MPTSSASTKHEEENVGKFEIFFKRIEIEENVEIDM